MSWPSSLLVGVLCGAVGLFAAGWVANLAVDWYAISSREGQAGYMVVLLAFFGFVAGLVIGIVASRIVAGGSNPGFGKALGYGQLAMLGAVALAGGAARLLADVAPTLNGQALLLAVELRWPSGSALPSPPDTGEWWLRLSAASGGTVRTSAKGPLWREDARQEDGQWIVPGAVEVFTSRGSRLITVEPEGLMSAGFIVPLPSHPKAKQLQWSEWLPRARPGAAPSDSAMTYRFRVVPRNEAIREERVGPFTIATIAQGFGEVAYGSAPERYTAQAQFAIRYRDAPVAIEEKAGELTDQSADQSTPSRHEYADAVAGLGGVESSLLVQVGVAQGTGRCYLLRDDGGKLATEYVSVCGTAPWAYPLTSDPARFVPAMTPPQPDGRVDRATFAAGGLYLFDAAVLDTRTSTVRRLPADETQRVLDNVPPLGISPDGRSFARLGVGEGEGEHVLYVRDIVTGATTVVPIATHVNANDYESLDPSWLTHYFAWEPGPGGGNRIVARRGIEPLPPRGQLSSDRTGFREYRIYGVKRSIRAALIDLLVDEFHAERVPGSDDAFALEVRIDGQKVNVSFDGNDEAGRNTDDNHLGVWNDPGTDTRLVELIAKRIDAVLAAGRFNAHIYR